MRNIPPVSFNPAKHLRDYNFLIMQNYKHKSKRQHHTMLVAWSPPPTHFFKINVDGVFQQTSKKGAYGFIVRNSAGFIHSMGGGFIGHTDLLITEICAVLYALMHAKFHKLTHIFLETDSQITYQCIRTSQTTTANFSQIQVLLLHIRSLMSHFQDMQVSHIFREANTAADFIASWTLRNEKLSTEFNLQEDEINEILFEDAMGWPSQRRVSTSNV